MLNTHVDVHICNVCRCTQYGNEAANTRDDNQCTDADCAEAIERYKHSCSAEREVQE